MRNKRYDFAVMLVPLLILIFLMTSVSVLPDSTMSIISKVKDFLGNQFGVYYLLLGLGFVVVALWIALSKYGKIRLGNSQKPKFSTISWSVMIFTSTMAADILFFSLHEWMFYWNSVPLDFNELTLQQKVTWSESYSLFHWGLTPWIFYILPAVAYAYMMHVKQRDRQKISEACRPILGKKVDGTLGKVIDIISVLALLLATSTTFTLATPLLSRAICEVTGLDSSTTMTICVILGIAVIYTLAVISGFKGISKVAFTCILSFLLLVVIFLIFGDTRFIIENGVNSIGNMFSNFLRMSTWTDPTRISGDGITGVPQDWTVFYWAYWIAWSVATPFFIAKISEGRTIKELVLGGTCSGVASTFLSFTVFGGFGIAEQASGRIAVAELVADGASPADVIITIFKQIPCWQFALGILIFAMLGFYASTFDTLTHVIASYSYKSLQADQEPGKFSKIYWSILFVLLPIALLFSESTTSQLQSLSIIAAFPISILMIIVIASFFKEVKSDGVNHDNKEN